MADIVTVYNINQIEYTALMELLKDIYRKDLPTTGLNDTNNLEELESLTIFFANQYSYIIELWARMVHEVRLLKRMAGNKEAIEIAMDKRDYLEKVMSAVKLKHYASSRLLKYHSDE